MDVFGSNHAAATAKSLQSCPTLCNPRDGSPPGSLIPGILQSRTLEWVAISFSNPWKWKVKVKSCPTPSDPMDCSLPGSSVHGIFQARVLENGVGCHCLLHTVCQVSFPNTCDGFTKLYLYTINMMTNFLQVLNWHVYYLSTIVMYHISTKVMA